MVELLRARRLEQAKQALPNGVSLSPDAYVFGHEADGSKPIRPDGVTQRFTALARRLEVDCRLHDLRHFLVYPADRLRGGRRTVSVASGTATAVARPWGPTRTSRRLRTGRPPS